MSKATEDKRTGKVLICLCVHKGQDELHGSQRRVHTPTKKPTPGWRCTVCGKVSGL